MRRRAIGVGVLGVLVAFTWVVLWALPTPAQFELDGNAVVDGGAGGDDWANTVPPPPSAGSEAVASVFIADGSGQATIFTTGGSKDVNDVSQWQWKDNAGGLPDKDNITNAYAAAYTTGANDLTFYFGLDRFANDGDAQTGFWFFKNQVQLAANGTFVGADGVTPATHAIGDVLVVVNMSNGGAQASAVAFRWVGGANPLLPIATEINSALCGQNSDPDLCAISNQAPAAAPWAYAPKQGVAGTFPTFSFIEGGINLTVLGGAGGGCFSSFLAETRSSTSPTATLKDFALGEFNTCKIDIAKACPTVTFDPATGLLNYTSHITVTNSGFGPVHDVTMIDTASSLPPETQVLATLAAGASHTFTHTFSLTPGPSTPNPPSNTATVSAAVAPGGQQIVTAGPVTAACPHVDFDASLTITKSCFTNLEVVGGKIVVAVTVEGTVCNIPPPPGSPQFPEAINNVLVTDTPPIEGQPLALGTLATGECKPYLSKYYPDALTLVNGIPSSVPDEQRFEDTAQVTGTGAISASAKTNTVTANCPLCPPVTH